MKTTIMKSEIKRTLQLSREIYSRSLELRVELQKEILALQNFQIRMEEKLVVLGGNLPSIVQAIESLGLGITNLGYSKTGIDTKKWSDDDKLRISINAEPTSKNFKFIKFAGFTKSGSGINDERLTKKAEKIENKIKEITGLLSVNVNKYSLEIKDENDYSNVLIEIWL